MTTIILVGIIGAIISAVIGTFWYMPSTLMGKVHMQVLGFDKLSKEEQAKKIEEAKPHMWKMYLAQIFLSFLTSIFIAFIVSQQKDQMNYVYMEIFAIWLCFTLPIVGQALLWSNIDKKLAWKKFFSDTLSNLVTFLVIAFVASLIL